VSAWLPALDGLNVGALQLDRHDHEDLLALRKFAPLVYERLLLEAVTQAHWDWSIIELFEDSAFGLASAAKRRILSAVRGEWRATWVFRLLRGAELAWAAEMVDEGECDIEFVLMSIDGHGRAPSLDSVADFCIPRGVNPRRVAGQIRYGTFTGEEHEVLQQHLDFFTARLADTSPNVRAMAEAGVALFLPELESAKVEARRRDL